MIMIWPLQGVGYTSYDTMQMTVQLTLVDPTPLAIHITDNGFHARANVCLVPWGLGWSRHLGSKSQEPVEWMEV